MLKLTTSRLRYEGAEIVLVGFSLVFLTWGFQWFFIGFSMVRQRVFKTHGFHGFSWGFPGFFIGLSWGFLGFTMGFLGVFRCFSWVLGWFGEEKTKQNAPQRSSK